MGELTEKEFAEAAYIDVSFGVEAPNWAWMSLRTYWQLRARFEPDLKLPRKMKKRYLGTRSRRRKADRAFKSIGKVSHNQTVILEDL